MFRQLLLVWLLISITFLTGCASSNYTPLENSNHLIVPAKKPSYAVGEYFSYDNGKVMLVSALDSNNVVWKYNNGLAVTAMRDFTVPPLQWNTSDKKSVTSKQVVSGQLWPLKVGNSETFITTQNLFTTMSEVPRVVQRKYRCNVKSSGEVTVEAGAFNVFEIVCSRYSLQSNSWRGTDTFYYSPEVGHYVQLKKERKGSFAEIQKVRKVGFNSTYLNQSDQQKLKRTLFEALSQNPDGVSSSWTSATANISVDLVPINTFYDENGNKCRKYQSIYNVNGKIRQQENAFCQVETGKWQKVKL